MAITILLLNRDPVQAQKLADRLEVSLRTIYRDLETLSWSAFGGERTMGGGVGTGDGGSGPSFYGQSGRGYEPGIPIRSKSPWSVSCSVLERTCTLSSRIIWQRPSAKALGNCSICTRSGMFLLLRLALVIKNIILQYGELIPVLFNNMLLSPCA